MADELRIEGLRYALEVAETESFTAAARNLGVTQPALSNGIARLESRLDNQLFSRSPRGVRATSFGTAMLPLIETALSGLDALSAEARRWDSPTPTDIRMGVSPLINPRLISRAQAAVAEVALAAFSDADPRRLVLREANRADLRDGLVAGELDILVIPAVAPLPRFSHRIIGSEPLVLVDGSSDSGSAVDGTADDNRAAASLDELSEKKLILLPDSCGLTKFTVDLLRERDLPLRPYAGEASSYRVLEEWSMLGFGSALLPESKVSGSGTFYRHVRDEENRIIEIFYEAVWDPASPLADDLSELSERLSG